MTKDNTNHSLQLVSAFQSGDRAAFAKIVDLYSTKIYRLALRILTNPDDAEDVLQETFIKAFNNLATFEGRSELSTWLYRIATNEALMLLRKKRVDLVPVEDDPVTEEEFVGTQTLVDWCCLPESEILSKESQAFLEEAVQKLSPALRVIFVLRDIEGFSIKETQEALGLSESVVKTRLFRARIRMRELLSDYFGKQVDGQEVENAFE
jgi:RNA polymerase sigma-70 factor (ECF subfamily)